MPSDQVVVYCKNCKKNTVQIKQRANHVLHLLLSVVTIGIWLIVWFFITLFTSDTPTCTECGNEVKNNNNRQTNKKEVKNKFPELKTQKLSKSKIFFIMLGVLLVIGIFIPDDDTKNKSKTTDKSKKDADNYQKGFHCLSGWDGSPKALVEHVKKNMREPDSFKHRETSIVPKNDKNNHVVIMTYSGKNGFGGVNVEKVWAILSADCKLVDVITTVK